MAGSIKLFSFNRKYYHVFGIYPPQPNQSGPSNNSRNRVIILSFVFFTVPCTAFLVFDAKSMLEYGMSFFGISAGVICIIIYGAILWKMNDTWLFIENCERFIEKRENSIIAYRKLIEKIDRLCEFLGIAGIFTILCFTIPFLLYTLGNYYILDLGEKSFVLLVPMKWPFDWKTPLGYFVAWLAQSAGITTGALTMIIYLNFFFGSCWLFMFMAEDITKDLVAFNNDVKANVNRVEWMKRFCDIIQLHSDGKNCVNDFNAIIKYSLFALLFFLMLSVTSMLLILQFQILDDNAELVETVIVFLIAIWIFGALFLLCELAQRVTVHFDEFGQELERCDWQKLPIEMQRVYCIFLSDTQNSKKIACYGNIQCTRETFKRIINNSWSYFITIRQFEV